MEFWTLVWDAFNAPLFSLGEDPVTLLGLLYLWVGRESLAQLLRVEEVGVPDSLERNPAAVNPNTEEAS